MKMRIRGRVGTWVVGRWKEGRKQRKIERETKRVSRGERGK